MFKRIFLVFISSLVLFGVVAPIFSFAAQDFLLFASVDEGYLLSLIDNGVGCYLSDGSDSGFFYYCSVPEGFSIYGSSLYFGTSTTNSGPVFTCDVEGPANSSFDRICGRVNLKTGAIYSNTSSYSTDENGYCTITGRTSTYFPLGSDSFYPLNVYCISPLTLRSSSYFNQFSDSFVRFLRPDASNYTIHSVIPEPVADLTHYYFADSYYLYSFFVAYPALYLHGGANASGPSQDVYMMAPYIKKVAHDRITFSFSNMTRSSVNLYVSKYDLVTGKFISTSLTQLPSNFTDGLFTDYPVYLNNPDKGIWYQGFINQDGLDGFNLLNVVFNDQLDYHPDFLAVENLLSSSYSELQSIDSSLVDLNGTLSEIYTKVNSINSKVQSIVSILNSNFEWFKTTYYNAIIGKWNLNLDKLDSIISILQGSADQTTLPHREDVSEGVSDYVSQESGFMDSFDSAGSDIDSIFNDIDLRFSSLRSSFSSVSNILEAFVFDSDINNGLTVSLFLFSLSFGIVILIIGKKV